MKGPGLRIDVDVRRAWRCPVCGQGQRLPTDITAPRCPCVRDGVPMKLAEGQRPGRLALRPELRSMLDRIQGGEEFPRMTSPLSADSEGAPREAGAGGYGGSKPRSRPPRPERSGGHTDRPPREPRPAELQAVTPAEPQAPSAPTQPIPLAVDRSTPTPVVKVEKSEDDFGAGLDATPASTPN